MAKHAKPQKNMTSSESIPVNGWRIAAIALMVTNILFAGIAFNLKDAGKKYPLIDPARDLIAQEHFIVNIQPLRETLFEIEQRDDGLDFSLYFEYLNTGANISLNNELRVWPASLLKLPMAIAVMKRVEVGQWTLNESLELLEKDKGTKYGTLWQKESGSKIVIVELLREMLTFSDNTAYNIFSRNIDKNDLIKTVVELGIEDLFNEVGLMSTKEYSRFFRALYTSSILKRESSQKLLELLAATEFREFLSAGLPTGTMFSHKFGIQEDLGAYLDSGIVYIPNRPYLITVAIKGTDAPGEREMASALMKEISQATFQFISTQ